MESVFNFVHDFFLNGWDRTPKIKTVLTKSGCMVSLVISNLSKEQYPVFHREKQIVVAISTKLGTSLSMVTF